MGNQRDCPDFHYLPYHRAGKIRILLKIKLHKDISGPVNRKYPALRQKPRKIFCRKDFHSRQKRNARLLSLYNLLRFPEDPAVFFSKIIVILSGNIAVGRRDNNFRPVFISQRRHLNTVIDIRSAVIHPRKYVCMYIYHLSFPSKYDKIIHRYLPDFFPANSILSDRLTISS